MSAKVIGLGVVALLVACSALALAPRSARAVGHAGVAMSARYDSGPSLGPNALALGSSGGETRVPVQLWTVLAAGGAMGVGLLLFLLRLLLGRVQPRSSHDEQGAGHH